MFDLPADLTSALDDALRDVPVSTLTASAARLSDLYRTQYGEGNDDLVTTPIDILAYAAYRLPATFCAVSAVIAETRDRLPHVEPVTLLDVGAGPGTAAWAATAQWSSLQTLTLLDRNPDMLGLGEALASSASLNSLNASQWIETNTTSDWTAPKTDVVIAAYVTGEVPPSQRERWIQRLWAHTLQTCILIEPGTPAGFSLIQDATRLLSGAGAHILAPVPCEWSCLASERDWTHFSVRVPRTRRLRATKSADLAYEDEKFSYVVASRQPGDPFAARVLRHPQIRRGHIRLPLCTESGRREIVVPKSRRDAYRLAKKLSWGDAVTFEDAQVLGLI